MTSPTVLRAIDLRDLLPLQRLQRLHIVGKIKSDSVSALKKFNNLTHLRIVYGTFSRDELDKTLRKLYHLVVLDLSDCQEFSGKAVYLKPGSRSLEHITFANESPIYIQEFLRFRDRNQHLKSINLANNLALELEEFVKCPSLEHVNLSKSRLLDMDELMYLNDLPNLSRLDIAGMNGGPHLAEMCSRLSGIRHLNIARNNIGTEGLLHLSRLDKLESLNLSRNSLDDDAMQHLAAFKRLRSLDICENNNLAERGFQAINEMHDLQSLNLNWMNHMTVPKNALNKLGHLSELDISANGWGAEEAQTLGQITSLRKLTMRANEFSLDGLSFLTNLKGLEYLDISRNALLNGGLGDEGAKLLSHLQHLKYLFAQRDEITDKGLGYLTSLKKLKRLDLSNNKIVSSRSFMGFSKFIDLDYTGNELADLTDEIKEQNRIEEMWNSWKAKDDSHESATLKP